MNPSIVALFGEIKSYLQSFLSPGPNLQEINQATVLSVKALCDHGYHEYVIECLNVVKNKLSLDDYYHVKNTFRYLEQFNYQFNYDFFRI